MILTSSRHLSLVLSLANGAPPKRQYKRKKVCPQFDMQMAIRQEMNMQTVLRAWKPRNMAAMEIKQKLHKCCVQQQQSCQGLFTCFGSCLYTLHCTVAAAHPESNAIYANTLHCGSSSTIEKTEKIYYAWISVIMTLITNKI